MNIAIYSKHLQFEESKTAFLLIDALKQHSIIFFLHESLKSNLAEYGEVSEYQSYKTDTELIAHNVSALISVGGDGTLLDTLPTSKNTGIPVLGLNLGRLGFLSNIPIDKIQEAVECLKLNHFRVETRSVLRLNISNHFFSDFPFALNDFTIHKRDTGSMITIDTYLNGEFFNTYWADGIIISTPTGSTAYSLSCGGPIIFPDSNNFVITPSAPHNLNIRPIIVSDASVLSFRVRGRGENHLISLDSRYAIVNYNEPIAIQKAPFEFKIIRLRFQNFITSLRDKLNWGIDNRNF
jgi:NAD+ kinase